MARRSLPLLFSAGYRIFFFLAGLFALFSMALWLAHLVLRAGDSQVFALVAIDPHMWHAHEFIFGYGSAAVAGFLLTAAPNWTKSKGASEAYFAAVSGLWLAGRLAFFLSGALPVWAVALVDLALLPAVGFRILMLLLRRPKAPQMILLTMIALVWSGNLMMHLEWLGWTEDTAARGMRVGVLALGALIVILGGRVTPAFTRNAMLRTGRETGLPVNPAPLAAASIISAIATVLVLLIGLGDHYAAVPAILAGVLVMIRTSLWRPLWTLPFPILWTLHLSYLATGAGLLMWGLAALGAGSEIAALHVLSIGGIAGMTLAVMSRAALGHSRRPLIAPKALAIAYGLVPVTAFLRYSAEMWPQTYDANILLSGLMWIAVFLLYSVSLYSVFTGPKLATPSAE